MKLMRYFMLATATLMLWSHTALAQLNQFYNEEQNAVSWQQRYASAPSGSWEEQQAQQARDQAIQRAIQAAGPYAYSGMNWTQIESFADQINQKYLAAPSGGAIEAMYRQVRDSGYQAFSQALQYYIQYNLTDWRQIHNVALQMDQKYLAAPSGSPKEQVYNQARNIAFQRLPQALQNEIYRLYNYRDIENLGEYFNSLYLAAPSGSLKENTYNQLRLMAYSQAVSKFTQQGYTFSQPQLMQIQGEFNNRYNAAPSGSSQEAYYRQIRDSARSLIHP